MSETIEVTCTDCGWVADVSDVWDLEQFVHEPCMPNVNAAGTFTVQTDAD